VTALAVAAAAGALLGWALFAALGVRTRRALLPLSAAPTAAPLPSVTAVVPCRDEARDIEAALRSLLAQELDGLRVVAVDDRSTDGTGEILDRLAAEEPRLSVLHVASLPAGWLGKTHACAAGAARARGEWLLFTDGDVSFGPGALRRALATALSRGVGHLAIVPRLVAPGLLERAFVTAFGALAAPLVRPWELPHAGTGAYVGVGAFNLVRRDAYEAAGGHRRLALEVVDDVKLGLLLRRSGVAQAAAESGGLVSVRWQRGFLPAARGLVKNAFAALEYRDGRALLAGAAGLAGGLLPAALALAAPSAVARALALAALLLSMGYHAYWARRGGAGGAEGALLPVCAAALGAVVLASALSARLRGAVVWRGTRYPLAALEAGCLRAADLPRERAAGWPAPDEPRAAPPADAAAIAPTRARVR
jgi:hypothetical protein